MAKNSQTAPKPFFEVVFRGKPKVVRGFLSGLVLGSGHDADLFFSFLDGVHHEGKAEKLAEMVGIRATECHVIVDDRTSALLKRLGKRIPAETGLEITAHRKIGSASVAFSYRAYAPRYDLEIRGLLDGLPAGLKLRGFKHREKRDPGAEGVEAYSPTHDYEACGEGTVAGPVDLVIALRRRFAEFPLIQAEDVVLKLS